MLVTLHYLLKITKDTKSFSNEYIHCSLGTSNILRFFRPHYIQIDEIDLNTIK